MLYMNQEKQDFSGSREADVRPLTGRRMLLHQGVKLTSRPDWTCRLSSSGIFQIKISDNTDRLRITAWPQYCRIKNKGGPPITRVAFYLSVNHLFCLFLLFLNLDLTDRFVLDLFFDEVNELTKLFHSLIAKVAASYGNLTFFLSFAPTISM